MTTQLWPIILVIIGTLVSAIAPIWLKKGSMKIAGLKSALLNSYLFGAVFLYISGLVIFIVALRYGDLSVLYPIASLSYIWANLLSIKFLGEKMNTIKWIAVTMIIIGVVFIGIGSTF